MSVESLKNINTDDVKGFATPPLEKPDAPTSANIAENRKATSAAIRAEDITNKLIDSKEEEIQHHKSECQTLKDEIDELQSELRCQQDRVEHFIDRNRELEITSRNSGWMVLFSTVFNISGSVLIGIAGLIKMKDNALEEKTKISLATAGILMAAMSALLYGLSWKLGPRKEKIKPSSHASVAS